NPAVSGETRRRVMEKAAEVNYRPNKWARGLRLCNSGRDPETELREIDALIGALVTNKSHLIGLIVPTFLMRFVRKLRWEFKTILKKRDTTCDEVLARVGRPPDCNF